MLSKVKCQEATMKFRLGLKVEVNELVIVTLKLLAKSVPKLQAFCAPLPFYIYINRIIDPTFFFHRKSQLFAAAVNGINDLHFFNSGFRTTYPIFRGNSPIQSHSAWLHF